MSAPGVMLRMPCLEQSPSVVTGESLRKHRFIGDDKRYVFEETQRFVQRNRGALDFLGLAAAVTGQLPHTTALSVTSGAYVGAIPVVAPHTGKPVADVQIIPRFGHGDEQIEEFLVFLGASLQPEYHGTQQLVSGGNVRPPLYLVAADYIACYEQVIRTGWQRFATVEVRQATPSGNVRWFEYAARSYDPQARLLFPCRRNALMTDHDEAQALRWVFDLAAAEVTSPQVPARLRQTLHPRIAALTARLGDIRPREVSSFTSRLSDPLSVRQAKEQANLLLGQSRRAPIGWRLDMSRVWEAYVQHVTALAARDLGGTSVPHPKLRALRPVPAWGLRYLEPDMAVQLPGLQIVVEAKYKSHMYNMGALSLDLSETHRADLHQVLAYCAFGGGGDRAALLVYPAAQPVRRVIPYRTADGSASISVMLVGLPFSVREVQMTREWVRAQLLKLRPPEI